MMLMVDDRNDGRVKLHPPEKLDTTSIPMKEMTIGLPGFSNILFHNLKDLLCNNLLCHFNFGLTKMILKPKD